MSDPTDSDIKRIRALRDREVDFLLAQAAKNETQLDHREAVVVLEQKSRELLSEYVADTKRIASSTRWAAWAAAASAVLAAVALFSRGCGG